MRLFSKQESIVDFKIMDEGLLNAVPHPLPMVKVCPKTMKVKPKDELGLSTSSIHWCLPVIDSMTTGFCIPLWMEFAVFKGEILVKSPPTGTIQEEHSMLKYFTVDVHDKAQLTNSVYGKNVVGQTSDGGIAKLKSPWCIKTPPGYSCLIVAPLHRPDIPVQVLPAIVDTDTYFNEINFPFFIKSNFEGKVPINTPIAQIIPFKRNKLSYKVSAFTPRDFVNHSTVKYKIGAKMQNAYATFFRAARQRIRIDE